MIVDKAQFDAAVANVEYSQIIEESEYTRIIYYADDGTEIAECTTWRDTNESEYFVSDALSIGLDDMDTSDTNNCGWYGKIDHGDLLT